MSGQHGVGLGEATKVWAYVGFNTFGGPAGQIAVMHRELVERRRWVSEGRFLHALNYCMVLPGPEAQQLATYIGWLMHGVPGGVIAGALFVIPGFVAMLALAASYVLFGTVTWVAGLLYGVQAAVVAIVAEAVIRIGRRTLRSTLLRATAGLSFVAIFFFSVPFPLIIGAAGLVGWLAGRGRPQWLPAAAHRGGARPARNRALCCPTTSASTAPPRAAPSARQPSAPCCGSCPSAALVLTLGSENIFAQEGVLFSKSARAHLRRCLRRARLHLPAGRRTVRMDQPAGNDHRPGTGRDRRRDR